MLCRRTAFATRLFFATGLALCAMFSAARSEDAANAKANAVDFVRDVRQILAQHCFECHGANRQESGLRLNSRASAMAVCDSGDRAIVPGDLKASRLVRLVRGEEPEMRMPPEGEGEPLSAEKIAVLVRWIEQGASWPAEADADQKSAEHWAWKKPVKAALPEVQNRGWPRQPLDAFILRDIEQAGLQPAEEADRFTLIRRVSLDLIGLPPTPEQIDAFVSDSAPDAYERMVDRTLADPAYGERWGRVWLDLARYADSKGYGSDPLRTIWRYRDWVIESFNRNLPYDQFTIDQLAGDLLPRPTADQILATAFHRNTMANDEGGTDDEEFRVAAVKDRIETTMQVWMGLTMGCAKCHSHKFDPLTQREYYQGYAFFNQTEDADRGDEEPRAVTPTLTQTEQLAERRAALAQVAPHVLPEPDSLVPVSFDVARGVATQLETQVREVEKQISSTPVMRELPSDKQRETHAMIKGNFKVLGEKVEPALPAAFHRLSSGGTAKDRLGLARWLVDRENALTARVAVNRLWAQLFGIGIVATQEDFGTQGLPPTHPEVLDWLAVEMMDCGWDQKAMLKHIVCSATYRQSSRASAAALQRDPTNRLLARGTSFRLEAEMVRDQALAISGLLCRKQGGESVYPPQPPNLWRAAFNGQRTWATSMGEDRYRRGLYTYWRRTVPYPSMAAFDAPSREICAIRRISTNTPLQAFVTLNDPVYVEAAQALARRMVREGGDTPETRSEFGLRLALGRPPQAEQIAQLVALYQSELAHFGQHSAEAAQIATDPLGPLPTGWEPAQLAAWTVVGNVLLNLDGVLTRR